MVRTRLDRRRASTRYGLARDHEQPRRQGRAVQTFQVLAASPGLEDLWQNHYSVQGGTQHHRPEPLIANLVGRRLPDAPADAAPVRMGSRTESRCRRAPPRLTITNSRSGATTIPASELGPGRHNDDRSSGSREERSAAAVWRWTVLVVISVAMFGNYYVYDSIAPVADSAAAPLGFTDTQIGSAQRHLQLPEHRHGAHRRHHRRPVRHTPVDPGLRPHLPGGRGGDGDLAALSGHGARAAHLRPRRRVDDRGGHRRDRPVVLGRQLGFAFGVNLSIARAGSYSADSRPAGSSRSTTWAGSRRCGWPRASRSCGRRVRRLLPARTQSARRYDMPQPVGDRRVRVERLLAIRSLLLVHRRPVRDVYSVIFPFRSTFAIKYFQHAHGLSLQEAGR